MKKSNYVPLRLDDKLLDLVKSQPGKSTNEKIRMLLEKALNVQPHFDYITKKEISPTSK